MTGWVLLGRLVAAFAFLLALLLPAWWLAGRIQDRQGSAFFRLVQRDRSAVRVGRQVADGVKGAGVMLAGRHAPDLVSLDGAAPGAVGPSWHRSTDLRRDAGLGGVECRGIETHGTEQSLAVAPDSLERTPVAVQACTLLRRRIELFRTPLAQDVDQQRFPGRGVDESGRSALLESRGGRRVPRGVTVSRRLLRGRMVARGEEG